MRIVARGTLVGFTRFRVQRAERELFKRHIDSWYAVVRRAQWTNSAELKQQLRSASIVSARRVVFNIKGNDYRLVAEINFQFQILFVKWLGTHKEYDKIDVLSVEYDKERYADPPDSK
ncbi:MAG: type II toxin-antitoxin system HigB family toxin [Edaphobacter sp.]